MKKIHQYTIGQGQPLVLVHGWAMHSGIWRVFAEQLAQYYQVTCIDLPGHGQSEALDSFTIEEVSDALVNAVTEPKSVWLGWSLGASVVLNIAQAYPERVSGLVILAGNPLFMQTNGWPGMKDNVLEAFAAQLRADCRGTLVRFLSLQVSMLDDYKAVLKQLKAAVLDTVSPDKVTLQGGLEILKTADLRTVVVDTQLPVLMILGTRDTLVPVEMAEAIIWLAPDVNVEIIEEAGHVPFLSHPDSVLERMRPFMEQQCV